MAFAVVAFVLEIWAFVVAVRAPAGAYLAAGKRSKGLWVGLTGAAALIGLSTLPLAGAGNFGGLLSIAALVVAGVFLADVRPAVSGRRPRPPKRQQGGW